MKKMLLALILLASTSLMAVPKAIVFDFGGVLTKEPNREAIVKFIRESLHLSQEQYDLANEEKKRAFKEDVSYEGFWLSYARRNNIQVAENWTALFKEVFREALGVDPRMYQLIEELKKQKISIALLSNIDERLGKLIGDAGFYKPFEPCLLSYEIGVEKPDPKAYETLLAQLKLPAKDVVFIDDRPENVAAAQRLGIDAIVFESERQLRIELARRGVGCQACSARKPSQ